MASNSRARIVSKIELGEVAVSTAKPSGLSSRRKASSTSRWSSTMRSREFIKVLIHSAGPPIGSTFVTRRACSFKSAYFQLFLHHASIEERNAAFSVAGESRIMRHHANGGTFAMQVAQQFHHSFRIARVQVSGRLIGQQDGGRSR